MTVSTPAATSVSGTPGAFGALYRLVLRHQLTRGRVVLFVAIVAIAIGLGLLFNHQAEPDVVVDGSAHLVSGFGLGLIVPVVSLVLGSAALGNWVEDETLVYVWLRPVRRWLIALAASAAALTVAIPVTAGSLGIMATLASGGDRDVIVGTLTSAALGSIAYSALFVALGLIIRRALIWGLVYVFIWEFFVARAGAGAARLSINSYASSILARFTDIDIRLADQSLNTSFITLLGVAAAGMAITTWRLARANVA